MTVVLIIKTNDGEITELPIIDKITIGRSSSCDIKITDSKISGQHCQIGLTAKGEVLFEDLGSTNGSYLNNSRIAQTMIKIHDVVRIGNTLIKIDDKKLNTKERLTIGNSSYLTGNEKTLPVLTDRQLKDPEVETPKEAKKPTLKIKKEKVENKPVANEWVPGNANIIEQEASSGMTKMLKIEKPKKKKA